MKVRATTPTRIDLAGGTLDLYPIYLLEEGGLTINCAIDTFCTVTVEARNDTNIHFKSLDLGIEETHDDINALSTGGELEILARAVRFFNPSVGLNITAENRVRKGSGLGASSSLLIAGMVALQEITGSNFTPGQIIDFAADLEAQCIRVPTGKQDYFAAIYGGVSALEFDAAGGRRDCLIENKEDIGELESRLVLSFTGEPRFSGATNWNMIKSYIEGESKTLDGMREIKKVAFSMRDRLQERDWNGLATMVDREWQNRRSLAEGVTNDEVERIMKAALEAGALANKLCGAGGGGGMITCIEPENREKVEAALSSAGADVMPFKIVNEGIRLERLQ